MLDICADALRLANITTARIDGTMSAKARAKVLCEFDAPTGGPKLLLCSLRAAGTGLNLVRANHCFMLDLWWNAGVEEQAGRNNNNRSGGGMRRWAPRVLVLRRRLTRVRWRRRRWRACTVSARRARRASCAS